MPSFKYSTQQQKAVGIRNAFKIATGRRLHVLAAWLDANLTDVQLQTLFGIGPAAEATLRTKLHNAALRLAAWDGEIGQ